MFPTRKDKPPAGWIEDINHLPERYRFSHNFCFFLHDQLVNTLKQGEEAHIFGHHIKIKNEGDGEQLAGLEGEALFEWLEKNGYTDDVIAMYFKQMCGALLADMLNFTYEALKCSQKGKLTVAYALLRKPFKENLFFLEWLLARPEDLLAKFHIGQIDFLSFERSLSVEDKESIISEALNKTNAGNWMPADFLYRIRFDKKAEFSMEPLFQKATHLVTTFGALKTEKQNFNFIFSDDKAWDTQWNHLYNYLPLLLLHTIYVIEALFEKFATREEGFDLTKVRTLIGCAYWMRESSLNFDYEAITNEIRNSFSSENLRCDDCKALIKFTDLQFLELYEDYSISCDQCDWSFDLFDMHAANK